MAKLGFNHPTTFENPTVYYESASSIKKIQSLSIHAVKILSIFIIIFKYKKGF